MHGLSEYPPLAHPGRNAKGAAMIVAADDSHGLALMHPQRGGDARVFSGDAGAMARYLLTHFSSKETNINLPDVRAPLRPATRRALRLAAADVLRGGADTVTIHLEHAGQDAPLTAQPSPFLIVVHLPGTVIVTYLDLDHQMARQFSPSEGFDALKTLLGTWETTLLYPPGDLSA